MNVHYCTYILHTSVLLIITKIYIRYISTCVSVYARARVCVYVWTYRENWGRFYLFFIFSSSVISKQISTVTITDRFSLTTHVVNSFMVVPKNQATLFTDNFNTRVRFLYHPIVLLSFRCGRCIRHVCHCMCRRY